LFGQIIKKKGFIYKLTLKVVILYESSLKVVLVAGSSSGNV
jgi:hypothetical protein